MAATSLPQKTVHRLYFRSSRDLSCIGNSSVNLIVTSPPYPMIEMWDADFTSQDADIGTCIREGKGEEAFEGMHRRLDRVWEECFRVLTPGSFACINIGDATRTVGSVFRLYSNHSRIISSCSSLGFETLPLILWRKQTNAPNKFMGSGMLPAGAYVTLEHEYIIVLRKGGKRLFRTEGEKHKRRESAFFWEERNIWFSDVWDFKGVRQDLPNNKSRGRSGAFPFELAYRLISMYSVKGDTVLDPFLGTGTTVSAAMAGGRNSLGIEIDESLSPVIRGILESSGPFLNRYTKQRLNRHLSFLEEEKWREKCRYTNRHFGFPVMTRQEKDLVFDRVTGITYTAPDMFTVYYDQGLSFEQPRFPSVSEGVTERQLSFDL